MRHQKERDGPKIQWISNSHCPYGCYAMGNLYLFNLQSTLVISKSKGLSQTLRDIRISTYQMFLTEENTN